MSILTNQFRNKPWFRYLLLVAVGAGVGASSYPILAPVVMKMVDAALCDGAPGCSNKELPPVIELPKKQVDEGVTKI